MIYLIHIDPPLAHARHYLGYCRDDRLQERMQEHSASRGAKILQAALRQGSVLYLARTFPEGDKILERQLKTQSHFKRLCPFCCDMFAHLKSEAFALKPNDPEHAPGAAAMHWRPHDQNRQVINKGQKTFSAAEAEAVKFAQRHLLINIPPTTKTGETT